MPDAAIAWGIYRIAIEVARTIVSESSQLALQPNADREETLILSDRNFRLGVQKPPLPQRIFCDVLRLMQLSADLLGACPSGCGRC